MADYKVNLAPGDTLEVTGVPAVTPPPPPPPPPPPGQGVAHGLFVVSQRPADVDALAHAYGYTNPADVSRITVYCDSSSWTSIAGYTPNLPVTRKLLLGVPLFPKGASVADVDANLGTFETLAGRLPPGTDWRIGWEPNLPAGQGFGWSGLPVTEYGPRFADVAKIAHAHGFTVTLGFDATHGAGTIADYVDAIGAANIDNIGTDFYWQASEADGDVGNQGNALTRPFGLAACALAARSFGKGLVLPEWGLYNADRPAFIAAVGAWLHNNGAAWEAYFAYPDSQRNLVHYPLSLAEYRHSVIPA